VSRRILFVQKRIVTGGNGGESFAPGFASLGEILVSHFRDLADVANDLVVQKDDNAFCGLCRGQSDAG
jgi:hypothetical protein